MARKVQLMIAYWLTYKLTRAEAVRALAEHGIYAKAEQWDLAMLRRADAILEHEQRLRE
jgi:hypothetical protein